MFVFRGEILHKIMDQKTDEKSKGPVTKKGAVIVEGHHTDISCTSFSNTIFIVVTQYQKFGNLVEVRRNQALQEMSPSPTYNTRVLLGTDEPLTHVIARNLASHISTEKSIIFAIALKDSSPQVVRSLANCLNQYKVW